MCGIACSIRCNCHCRRDGNAGISRYSALFRALARRGPDSQNSVEHHIALPSQGNTITGDSEQDASSSVCVSLTATVLRMRGRDITNQPLTRTISRREQDKKYTTLTASLCWNGEVFASALQTVLPYIASDPNASDSEAVFNALLTRISNDNTDVETGRLVVDVLSAVRGPFAFAFYVQTQRRRTNTMARDATASPSLTITNEFANASDIMVDNYLYFGRDPIGRRSLCLSMNRTRDGEGGDTDFTELLLSSVLTTVSEDANDSSEVNTESANNTCNVASTCIDALELPPLGVYRASIVTHSTTNHTSADARCNAQSPTKPILLANEIAAAIETSRTDTGFVPVARRLLCEHCNCSILIELCRWNIQSLTQLQYTLPLPCCRADTPLVRDDARQMHWLAVAATELLRRLSAAVKIRVQGAPFAPRPAPLQWSPGMVVDVTNGVPAGSVTTVEATLQLLMGSEYSAKQSSEARMNLPLPCSAERAVRQWQQDSVPEHSENRSDALNAGATVAVLFSGGIDSMLLARLAHEHVPNDQPIDLINVCFSNASANRHRDAAHNATPQTRQPSPDRLAAIAGWHTLRAACPGRRWQFICVDEDFQTALARGDHIRSILSPRRSHLDFNIGCALWHAAQGVGFVYVSVGPESPTNSFPISSASMATPQENTVIELCAPPIPPSLHHVLGNRVLRYAVNASATEGSNSSSGNIEREVSPLPRRESALFSLSNYNRSSANGPRVEESSSTRQPSALDLRNVAACISPADVREAIDGTSPVKPGVDEMLSDDVSHVTTWSKPLSVELQKVIVDYVAEVQEVRRSLLCTHSHSNDVSPALPCTALPQSEANDGSNPTGGDDEEDENTKSHSNQAQQEPDTITGDQTVMEEDTRNSSTTHPVQPMPHLFKHRHVGCPGVPIVVGTESIPCSQNSSKRCARRMCASCCAIATKLHLPILTVASSSSHRNPVKTQCTFHHRQVIEIHDDAINGKSAEDTVAVRNHSDEEGTSTATAPVPPAISPTTTTTPSTHTALRVLVRSSARVLLSGIGADELFAGYGRHRTAFSALADGKRANEPDSATASRLCPGNGGWERLRNELLNDCGRLWFRNLGRDDRVVSDAGREIRAPFLDESVMALMLWQVPLPLLADLCEAPGVGDKTCVRIAAHALGLSRAASLVKRAMHFGCGLAKASNRAAFGSNSAANRQKCVADADWTPIDITDKT